MIEKLYACSRCDGTGLTPFKSVIGGVCFKCHGSGKQLKKPNSPIMWAVFGLEQNTGKSVRLYNVSAKSEHAAIEKARNTMSAASSTFKEANTLAVARAIQFVDMADQTACTWEEAITPKEQP